MNTTLCFSTVIIADANPLLRLGIKVATRPNSSVAIIMTDCSEKLRALVKEKPHSCIVTTDYFVTANSESCMEFLHGSTTTLKTVIVTNSTDGLRLRELVNTGASAIVHAEQVATQLSKALLYLSENQDSYYCPVVLRMLALPDEKKFPVELTCGNAKFLNCYCSLNRVK